jgi:hypothetical protein
MRADSISGVIRGMVQHTCLCGNLATLAQTRWCLERTRTFVALRLETEETSAFEGKRLSP